MIKKLYLTAALSLVAVPAWAGVVQINVSGNTDSASGSCNDSGLAQDRVICDNLRKAIDYINDPIHCTRAGVGAESLSYVITIPEGASELAVQNNVSDRNNVNASLDDNRTGDYDIHFGCFTPVNGPQPTVTIQSAGNSMINANGINSNNDPDRIFDVHNGKIHFKNVSVRGGKLAALPEPSRCDINSNQLGAGILVRPGAEVILENAKVIGNQANCGAGGGIANLGKLGMINSEVSGNASGLGGMGGLTTADQVSNHNGSDEKYSMASGGGIYNLGELYVVNSSINGNRAGRFGGGVMNTGSNAKLFFNNVNLSENLAAGTYQLKHAGNMSGMNLPLGMGGAIMNASGAKAVMLNSTVAKNKALYAAGISNGGQATYGMPRTNNLGAGLFFKVANTLFVENLISSISSIGGLNLQSSQLPQGVSQQDVGELPLTASARSDVLSHCWAKLEGNENKITSLSNNIFGASADQDPDCSNSLKNSSPTYLGANNVFSNRANDQTFNPACSEQQRGFYTCRVASAVDNYNPTLPAIRWYSYAPMAPFDQRGKSRVATHDIGAYDAAATADWQGSDPNRINQMLAYPGSASSFWRK